MLLLFLGVFFELKDGNGMFFRNIDSQQGVIRRQLFSDELETI
jgi:hypothetical protein